MPNSNKPFCVVWDLNFTGEISLGQWNEIDCWYVFPDGDCYIKDSLTQYKHQFCDLRELQDVLRGVAQKNPEKKWMPVNQFIVRKEDMSRHGRIRLIKQDDGDICVGIITERGEDREMVDADVEFCSCSSGGGKSPRTLAALDNLALAMMEDNEKEPSRAADR